MRNHRDRHLIDGHSHMIPLVPQPSLFQFYILRSTFYIFYNTGDGSLCIYLLLLVLHITPLLIPVSLDAYRINTPHFNAFISTASRLALSRLSNSAAFSQPLFL